MKTQPRMVTLTDFLTPAEIAQAAQIYPALRNTGKYAAIIADSIITPNLARINAALGQENDARYLAYLVEYVMSTALQQSAQSEVSK